MNTIPKKAGFAFFTTIMFCIFSMAISCKQDSCKSVSCAYGGSCVNGLCTCQPGYEGTNCETISRDKFLGQWEATEAGPLGSLKMYGLVVVKDVIPTRILLKNLGNSSSDETISCDVYGDSLTISPQPYGQGTISGIGRIPTSTGSTSPNNQMSLTYTVVDGSGITTNYVVNCSR